MPHMGGKLPFALSILEESYNVLCYRAWKSSSDKLSSMKMSSDLMFMRGITSSWIKVAESFGHRSGRQ